MIFTSWPSLIAAALPDAPASVHISSETSLLQLQGRLNVTRRSLRLFRFLDSFNLGWKAYVSEDKSLETWLDVIGKSCLGIFGMLESVTLLDLMAVDHLEPFGKTSAKEINRQAQMFWFAALYASVLTTCIKVFRLFAHTAVPQSGTGYGIGEDPMKQVSEKPSTKEEEREQIKAANARSKAERKAWMIEVNQRVGSLGLKLVSDMLDLVLPSTAVGWISIDPGLVGSAMLCSTVISSMDVWARCGRQVDARSG